MRFPDDAPVRPFKLDELRRRLEELNLDPERIRENAVKGSGRGGQKLNKTSSAIQLRYTHPTLPDRNFLVDCHESRSKSLNRFLALRLLADKVQEALEPGSTRAAREAERRRKQKKRRKRRSSSAAEKAPE